MKLQPISYILCGLLGCSIWLNILSHQHNQKLVYKVQRLEAGPARGIFEGPEITHPLLSDEEFNNLIESILKKMMNKYTV